jgi:hypothetical protein
MGMTKLDEKCKEIIRILNFEQRLGFGSRGALEISGGASEQCSRSTFLRREAQLLGF